MILTDIIALAKAGYSVADVKELLALPSEPPKDPPAEPKDNAEENTPKGGAQPTSTPKDNAGEPSGAVDYKELYEQTLEELKNSQAQNINTNIKDDTSDKDELKKLVRAFM